MNYRELTKKLSAKGCYYDREGKGSHKLWYSPITDTVVSIPYHSGKDLKIGTVKQIGKDAGVRLL